MSIIRSVVGALLLQSGRSSEFSSQEPHPLTQLFSESTKDLQRQFLDVCHLGPNGDTVCERSEAFATRINALMNSSPMRSGSAQEIEERIHTKGPFETPFLRGFIKKFSSDMAGSALTPPFLIEELVVAILNFIDESQADEASASALRASVPQILSAFASDPDMEAHLLAFWSTTRNDQLDDSLGF